MKQIKVVVTMDCEPITSATHASATGPSTWELGKSAVTGYAEIARSYGFPVTYFVHPETALAQANMFNQLAANGACIALHMHPWKYSMSRHGGRRYLEHYGGLSENEQRWLLGEASALWAEAMGRRPEYFRSGTFSANDSVFKVMAECGFRGGSCSLPGRLMPEMRAVWTGTVPDPHRTHPHFRHLEGNLDVAEMPLSVDFSRSLKGKMGGVFHPDLRPDIDWMAQYGLSYRDIAFSIVEQVIARAPDVPVINLLTHNHYDFSDPAHVAYPRIVQALEAVHAACKSLGVVAVPATIADVTDAVLATPARTEGFVCEGGVYDQTIGVAKLDARTAA